jgi:hypothetical protein
METSGAWPVPLTLFRIDSLRLPAKEVGLVN